MQTRSFTLYGSFKVLWFFWKMICFFVYINCIFSCKGYLRNAITVAYTTIHLHIFPGNYLHSLTSNCEYLLLTDGFYLNKFHIEKYLHQNIILIFMYICMYVWFYKECATKWAKLRLLRDFTITVWQFFDIYIYLFIFLFFFPATDRRKIQDDEVKAI